MYIMLRIFHDAPTMPVKMCLACRRFWMRKMGRRHRMRYMTLCGVHLIASLDERCAAPWVQLVAASAMSTASRLVEIRTRMTIRATTQWLFQKSAFMYWRSIQSPRAYHTRQQISTP